MTTEHTLLFAGSSHPALAQSVADELGIPLSPMTTTRFSCGEMYVKYEASLRGKDVYLLQTGRTGHMNDDMIELMMMIDAARQSFAASITVVLPYMPYSRQDKIHAAREGISAKLMANLIVGAGADHVITLHLHADQIQGFFGCPVDNLNPRRLLAAYFKAKNLPDPVVVSPDAGGAKDAKKFANMIGAKLCILHKQRPEHNVSEVTHVVGDVVNKTPILVDDMVDTAGSVCGAKEAIISAGSRPEVYLCATHAIFSGPAVERLSTAKFAEIVTTDSLPVATPPTNYKVLSVAGLIADVIRNSSQGLSVSQLHL